jgi:hypothetical protein
MQIRNGESYGEYVLRVKRRLADLEQQLSLTPSIEWQSVIRAELEALSTELTELGEVQDISR